MSESTVRTLCVNLYKRDTACQCTIPYITVIHGTPACPECGRLYQAIMVPVILPEPESSDA